MNLRPYQRGRIIDLKNCPGHNWRNTGKQLLSYIFTNIQLEPLTTPKTRHCNVMVLCVGQSHYSHGWMILQHQQENFRPQSTALFPCAWEKWRTLQQLNWNKMFCPSNPSSHWNSLHTKAPLLQHICLDRAPLQLCKKHNRYRHSTSPQNMERPVNEIRSRIISNSGKQSRVLQSEKVSNYRLWAVLMVLAINQK